MLNDEKVVLEALKLFGEVLVLAGTCVTTYKAIKLAEIEAQTKIELAKMDKNH